MLQNDDYTAEVDVDHGEVLDHVGDLVELMDPYALMSAANRVVQEVPETSVRDYREMRFDVANNAMSGSRKSVPTFPTPTTETNLQALSLPAGSNIVKLCGVDPARRRITLTQLTAGNCWITTAPVSALVMPGGGGIYFGVLNQVVELSSQVELYIVTGTTWPGATNPINVVIERDA